MTNLKNVVLKNAKLKNDNLEKLQQENGKRHQEQIEQHITIIAEMRYNLIGGEHGFPLFLFQ